MSRGVSYRCLRLCSLGSKNWNILMTEKNQKGITAMLEVNWMDDIDEAQVEDIGQFAKDWAFLHGIILRTRDEPGSSHKAMHTPFTMFPSPVPAHLYNKAIDIHVDFTLLMHRVAHDHDFLENCLKNVVKIDDFTYKLWKIYETVRQEGITQPFSLGLFRNDYMLDTRDHIHKEISPSHNSVHLKQVEYNTIAAGMTSFSTEVSKYHRYILSNYLGLCNNEELDKKVPENNALEKSAKGLVKAWELYDRNESVILFVVNDIEQNIFDHRQVEFAAFELNPRVKAVRKTFKQIGATGSLDNNKRLWVDGKEVAVAYFRAGYSPSCYASEQDWDARLLIERSRAIKCPSINFHLAGAKKIQQELCKEGTVERFMERDAAKTLRTTFMNQFSLDEGSEGDQAIEMALNNPQRFVLKPQREGGGNNIYGCDMVPVLTKIKDTNERNAFILMELIQPLKVCNFLIKPGEKISAAEVVGEFGTFGVLLGSQDMIMENYVAGHMLRTKYASVQEGGVTVGAACLDSPYLV